jgi:uncharacterized protein YlzI (FlbEa/FlbD family)
MVAEFVDSVTGSSVHINPDFVVTLRPDPDNPLDATLVKLKDGETFRVRGDHDEVAEKLDRPA